MTATAITKRRVAPTRHGVAAPASPPSPTCHISTPDRRYYGFGTMVREAMHGADPASLVAAAAIGHDRSFRSIEELLAVSRSKLPRCRLPALIGNTPQLSPAGWRNRCRERAWGRRR